MNTEIEKARIIFLDTKPLIYFLKASPDYFPSISEVLDLVYRSNREILLSSVTLYELSKYAFSKGDTILARQYREFFSHSKNVKLCSIDSEVAIKAAEYTIKYDLDMNESLNLSIAFIHGADCFLTESNHLKAFSDFAIIPLNEI